MAKGFNTYSKILDSYIKSGFGSGFIYVADNGDNFVITNRHVVSQAETASIEIENNSTGKIDKYENLTVILTDDEIDSKMDRIDKLILEITDENK